MTSGETASPASHSDEARAAPDETPLGIADAWPTSTSTEPRAKLDGREPRGESLWNRLGDRKATAITAAVAAVVLAGSLLAMSMVTDTVSFSTGGTQPAGGEASITAPTDPAGDPIPPQASTAPPPSVSPSTTGPSRGDDDEEREDNHEDEDEDHEGGER
ncbi:hypothetical protein [Streptomyces sp. Inha503]|uniref:hypothetical protein n=1 Tax=Streptomyces sp. Inha503 TaxID=3383314 RepID=UPI0039A2BBFC